MYKKLLKVQKEIGAIGKDSTNPFFKSAYFDINKLLDVAKPILNSHGLVLLQTLSNINGVASIKTMIIDPESGQSIEENTPLTQNPDPQKMGSAITYFRRYSLQSLLGLQAEDDDGNKASGKGKKKVEKKEESLTQIKAQIEKGFDFLKTPLLEASKMREEYLGDNPIKEDYELLLKTLRVNSKVKGEKKWVRRKST